MTVNYIVVPPADAGRAKPRKECSTKYRHIKNGT